MHTISVIANNYDFILDEARDDTHSVPDRNDPSVDYEKR